MRVAVTGARGRLGRSLIAALEEAPFTGPAGPIAWSRPELDLDALAAETAGRLLDRDRPDVVIHAAAWTDVDGNAREPDLALRRNGVATGLLAEATAVRGLDLIVISTNEVFDGARTDGRGYRAGEPTSPINAYGQSKLEGERFAIEAYTTVAGLASAGRDAPDPVRARPAELAPFVPADGAPAGPQLAIVRTAWLFGRGEPDFPAKILANAERAKAAGEALRAVHDETGSPTSTDDLAEAIVELLWAGRFAGLHHLVNTGTATRAEWAREVLRLARVDVPIEEVPASTWPRASTPPRWAVLEPTPLPSGEPMRPWQAALADRLARR
jgi:dTDP-4-dehydrorhamnose reductase